MVQRECFRCAKRWTLHCHFPSEQTPTVLPGLITQISRCVHLFLTSRAGAQHRNMLLSRVTNALPEHHRLEEACEARHFSRLTPRDFDVSPFLSVVKPLPVGDFDYRRLRWAHCALLLRELRAHLRCRQV